jgi:hypothetical protein
MRCFIPQAGQRLALAKFSFRSADGYTGLVFIRYLLEKSKL